MRALIPAVFVLSGLCSVSRALADREWAFVGSPRDRTEALGSTDQITDFSFGSTRDGRSVLYATSKSGLFRSDDLGRTWIEVYDDPVPDILVDPSDGHQVYIPHAYNGSARSPVLKYSADGGRTWEEHSLPDSLAELLALQPGAAHIVYGRGRNSELYRSTDCGARWTRLAAPPRVQISTLTISPSDPRHLTLLGTEAASSDWVLYHSGDGGISWDKIGAEGRDYERNVHVVWSRAAERLHRCPVL